MPHLRGKLGKIGVAVDVAKIITLSLLDHDSSKVKIDLLDGICVRVAAAGGLVVVRVSVGSGAFIEGHTWRAKRRSNTLFAHIPDK